MLLRDPPPPVQDFLDQLHRKPHSCKAGVAVGTSDQLGLCLFRFCQYLTHQSLYYLSVFLIARGYPPGPLAGRWGHGIVNTTGLLGLFSSTSYPKFVKLFLNTAALLSNQDHSRFEQGKWVDSTLIQEVDCHSQRASATP